ncbi:MAG TPA: LytR C-terminal domain-containing protein [Coriobacteriia bacterium]
MSGEEVSASAEETADILEVPPWVAGPSAAIAPPEPTAEAPEPTADDEAPTSDYDAIQVTLARRGRGPSGAQKRTLPQEQAEPGPPGWRTTRRTSRIGKQIRRHAKAERIKGEVGEKASAAARATGRGLTAAGALLAGVVVLVLVLWGAAVGVNQFARWNAKRIADANSEQVAVERARENLVVIGVKDKQALGFVALKAERAAQRVVGIALPDGAFVEVPGQGYERLGDSYPVGAAVSRDAIANFLMVPFLRYIVVDEDAYQALVTGQDVSGLVARTAATDMTAEEEADLEAFLKTVPKKEVWIVPLPVRPIAVGDQRYYEPQSKEIADIVLQWWGVRLDQQKQAVRVILFNGVGTPGVAGKAAQQLIRKGVRVIDSKNADNFDYKQTQILLYHGTQADAQLVKDTLGVGTVSVQSTPQNVADIIVIIGSDYVPPSGP